MLRTESSYDGVGGGQLELRMQLGVPAETTHLQFNALVILWETPISIDCLYDFRHDRKLDR